jgi:hypothetical protein
MVMKFPTAILATLILAGGTAFVITAPKMSFANPLAGGAPANVLIYHNDGFNDGQNLKETVLTPDVVRSANFGKLLSIHLAGAESGQPLFKAGVNITVGPHQGVQNVVFVALNNDSVWAINADTGAVLWKTSLLTRFHGVADTVAAADGNRSTGRGLPLEDTPAIDPNTNVLYVECEESEKGPGTDGALHWIHMLSALNLANGTRYAKTVNIAEGTANAGYISGPAVNRIGGGRDVFDARDLTCRCLTLDMVNHTLYMAWGDPGDGGPYNGWIVGYDAVKNRADTLHLQALWCAVPSGHGTGSTRFSDGAGGIWQGGGGIAVDARGNLYVETGNGTFDTQLIKAPYSGRLNTDVPNLRVPCRGDYGDSCVKLSPDSDTAQQADNPNGFGLHVSDYFTPKDEQSLNAVDQDLGSSSPVLLPNSVGNARHRQLMIINDKQGTIYLLDRNHMGGYHGNAAGRGGGANNVVQELKQATGRTFSTGAFYAGTSANSGMIYYVGIGSYVRAFLISHARIHARPIATSRTSYGAYSYPGSTPEISAHGGRDGILWTLDERRDRLVAYNALNLHDLLFCSDQVAADALTGKIVTFNTPMVANGRVYVGTRDALNVYGLVGGWH